MWENLFVIATKFETKKTTKRFNRYAFFLNPCHKLYKEGVFNHVPTLKYMCQFEMNSKKLNNKSKT
jgi:hypothetical protein